MNQQFQNTEHLPYRKCVGIMLINSQGLVWVGKRSKYKLYDKDPKVWQMPQGGIDKGEEPFQAAKRELYEETSVTSVSLIAEAPEWYSYDIPDEYSDSSRPRKFRGQTQKWFAFRFEGDDTEINILKPPDNHQVEFIDWRWEKLSNLPNLVVSFKREVYLNVVDAFSQFVVE